MWIATFTENILGPCPSIRFYGVLPDVPECKLSVYENSEVDRVEKIGAIVLSKVSSSNTASDARTTYANCIRNMKPTENHSSPVVVPPTPTKLRICHANDDIHVMLKFHFCGIIVFLSFPPLPPLTSIKKLHPSIQTWWLLLLLPNGMAMPWVRMTWCWRILCWCWITPTRSLDPPRRRTRMFSTWTNLGVCCTAPSRCSYLTNPPGNCYCRSARRPK